MEWQIVFALGFIIGWFAKGIGSILINKYAKSQKGVQEVKKHG